MVPGQIVRRRVDIIISQPNSETTVMNNLTTLIGTRGGWILETRLVPAGGGLTLSMMFEAPVESQWREAEDQAWGDALNSSLFVAGRRVGYISHLGN